MGYRKRSVLDRERKEKEVRDAQKWLKEQKAKKKLTGNQAYYLGSEREWEWKRKVEVRQRAASPWLKEGIRQNAQYGVIGSGTSLREGHSKHGDPGFTVRCTQKGCPWESAHCEYLEEAQDLAREHEHGHSVRSS